MSSTAELVAAVTLAGIFGWAGVTKAFRLDRWRRDLSAYRLARPVKALGLLVLPWVELLVTATVVAGAPRVGAFLALGLLLLFCLAIIHARNLQGTNKLSCGCLGGSSARDYRILLLRNAGLGALAAILIASDSARAVRRATAGDGVGALPILLAALTAVAIPWILWHVSAYLRRQPDEPLPGGRSMTTQPEEQPRALRKSPRHLLHLVENPLSSCHFGSAFVWWTPMGLTSLRRRFNRRFRTHRMQEFWDRFEVTTETLVLDVGGTAYNWSILPHKPRVVVLNVSLPRTEDRGDTLWLVADGRRLPFKDSQFDILFSNSVIEHVGTNDNQRAFANECRRVGRRYYVQTPNKWFPIDPHMATPLIHWLPRRIQRRLLRRFTLWGIMTKPSPERQRRKFDSIWLLDFPGMKSLFPDAEIWRERALGLTKSLIAAKLWKS